MTKDEKNRKQREYRARVGNVSTQKYEKTPKGFLVRAYRNMQSRITGVQRNKHHLYEGKELLDRKQFYDWSWYCGDFEYLFKKWVESGYDQRLTPSVDRVDPDKGYELSNIRWVTHSFNSANTRRWST